MENALKRLLLKMMGKSVDIPGNRNEKQKCRIESLIGAGTKIEGNIQFCGGLRLDGEIIGNVIAVHGKPSTLVLGVHGRVDGEICAAFMELNGAVEGPVHAEEYLDLQCHAKVIGNVHYKLMEIQSGAIVEGRLTRLPEEQISKVVTIKQRNGTEQR